MYDAVMRYPYDLFLKFLITRKADVNATLVGLGMAELSTQEYQTRNLIVGSIPPSVKEFIDSGFKSAKGKKKFIEWCEAHSIRELWEIQPEFLHSDLRVLTKNSNSMKKACDIFADAKKRTAMSLLFMREFEDQEVIDIFSDKFYVELDTEAIRLCKQYFFDFKDLTHAEWRNLLGSLAPEERNTLSTAKAHTSKEFVEYSVGGMPRVTLETVLHDIMVTSYYKFKQTANQPLMDKLSMSWAALAMQAGTNKARHTGGDKRSLHEELQMRFDFVEPEFPTLAELASGPKPELSTGDEEDS